MLELQVTACHHPTGNSRGVPAAALLGGLMGFAWLPDDGCDYVFYGRSARLTVHPPPTRSTGVRRGASYKPAHRKPAQRWPPSLSRQLPRTQGLSAIPGAMSIGNRHRPGPPESPSA